VLREGMKRQRRVYETTALAAVRKTRQLALFWARRCRKSTTLGNIAFDEMAASPGRTVIAASASLLLGKELVGMTLSATEQAALVFNEAASINAAFQTAAADKSLDFRVADTATNKEYATPAPDTQHATRNTSPAPRNTLTPDDLAALYKSSNMEMRLYFDRTTYSRLKIIAPNPATARGWGGTVLRDEAGYTPIALENELRVAVKPIMDTDKSFKLIYACNLCPNDRHPWFETTMPPVDASFSVNPSGNFYRGQNNLLIHRVTLADAYAAGHQLYDDSGTPLTLAEFRSQPANKLGLNINYDLVHESGGTAAIDLIALLTAQRRGAGQCHFAFCDDHGQFLHALTVMRGLLRNGRVGIGFDVATTTGESSNPSCIYVMEQVGGEYFARLIVVFKSKVRAVMVERLEAILKMVRARPDGGPARRLCIDASSERLAAEETKNDLQALVPVELVIAGMSVQPPGYQEPTNYKTYQGDLYSAAVNENRIALPADGYIKTDHRMVMKDGGRYVCTPDGDGRHGDTFDAGKQALYALESNAGGMTTMDGVATGHNATGDSRGARMPFCPPRRTV
jgi:hypothetical protein